MTRLEVRGGAGVVTDGGIRDVDGAIGLDMPVYAAGPSVLNLVLVLALTRWMAIARVTRAATLSLSQTLFVEAAQSLGASHLRVVVAHILPNLTSTLLSQDIRYPWRASEAG